MRRFLDRLGSRSPAAASIPSARQRSAAVLPMYLAGAPDHEAAADPGRGLEVKNLTVRFGGLIALDDVSFAATSEKITGIIGPNGAGKTTLFNACSGLNRRIGGEIWLDGQRVDRRGPATRARMGLGRTFQTMHLADSLTVAQNVALGYEAGLAGNNVLSQLAAPPGQVRRVNEAVTKAMDECGIAHLAELQAGALSTGQRRLVELARCLAGPFEILLLDEPSSGLDAAETAELGALLEHVRVERGCTILLVEHDMSLVMNVCSYIYVLDFGKLIFQGAPQAVAASPVVREAYLGVPTPNTSHLDARQ
jgi:ABC-type branched-subunit amino acid transport system ATPase component